MIGVFFVVMLMLVLTLGLTGYSDRILTAVVGEQLRAERTSLAETIRDPDQLEKVLADRKQEFEAFYGLDRPWWVRLPGMVLRVMTLDLGEARNLRSRMVHEYRTGAAEFAESLLLAKEYSLMLMSTYNRLRKDARQRLHVDEERLPEKLTFDEI